MMVQQFCVAVTVAAMFLSIISAEISICKFTPTINGMFAPMMLNATAVVNTEAVSGVQPTYTLIEDNIYFMGMQVAKDGGVGPNIQIEFTVERVDTKSSPDRVNISLTLKNEDSFNISAATLEINLGSYIVAFFDVGIPSGSLLVDRSYVGYNASNINSGSSVTIYFMAIPSGTGGVNLPERHTDVYATVYFNYQATTYGAIIPSICLKRVTTLYSNIIYEHGFTALTFFIMLIVGILLAILGVFLVLPCRRRKMKIFPIRPKTVKSPRKGTRILGNPDKESRPTTWHDSILHTLILKDNLQMYREIDNMDILTTVTVDKDIESEHTDASVQTSILLVQGLRYNGDITKTTENKAKINLTNRLKELEKKLDAEYEKELKSLHTDIEAKNKEKYGDLFLHHKIKEQEVTEKVNNLSETEKQHMLDLTDQQLQTEKNELTYKLGLEQKEKTERLRKEFAVCKRMGVTEIQQQFIDEIVEMGGLDDQKAKWLMKEHKQKEEEIHRLYDNEISQQRLNLEEKLARRRALAAASEAQGDYHTGILNLMASVQLEMTAKMKKKKIMSPELLEKYLMQAKTDFQSEKSQMDRETELKQNEMVKRFGLIKTKCLDLKINEHSAALKQFISKSQSMQTETPIDPISYVTELVNLKSQHRQELSELENKIDEAQAKELEVMRDHIAENTIQKLKTIERSLAERFKAEGIPNDVIDNILKAHEKEVNEMTSKQLINRQHQQLRLKDELARRKRELQENKAREKQEQQEVREYEAKIAQNLLNSQIAISDTDREKILKEFEKQMLNLENSLTLNKLKQQRLLEDKIAARRAHQLEEQQQKHNAELTKLHRIAENNGEEDDEETHRKELALKNKHTQHQLAVIKGSHFNIEQELKDIRVEMIKDRANLLKEHEERLGALITSLQLNKARQTVKIEEQQNKISNLKASLMNHLISNNFLSMPQCDEIVNKHKQEHDKLKHRLDRERIEQEKALMAKLKGRQRQREDLMIQEQNNNLKSLESMDTNKISDKIKHALLNQKQKVELETYRNKIEREKNQHLEDTRRTWEIEKQKRIQENEVQFLAGLIKVGNFDRSEQLLDVLHVLFPGKTEEALTELLNQISLEDESTQTKGTSSRQLIKKESEMDLTPRDENTRSRNVNGLLDGIVLSKGQEKHYVADDSGSDNSGSYTEDKHNLSKYDRYHEESEEEDYIGKALKINPSETNSSYPRRLSPLQSPNKSALRKKNRFLKKLAEKEDTL